MYTQFTPDIRPGARLQTDPKECISVLLIAVAIRVFFLRFFPHYHCVWKKCLFWMSYFRDTSKDQPTSQGNFEQKQRERERERERESSRVEILPHI